MINFLLLRDTLGASYGRLISAYPLSPSPPAVILELIQPKAKQLFSIWFCAMIVLALFMLLGLGACAKAPVVISTPTGKNQVLAPSPPPAKRAPAAIRIPATQRPYQIGDRTFYPIPSAYGFMETGIASWYGGNFHGRRTANHEVYDKNALTAAHKTLPMNTYLLVTNLENGKEITVRINDRGPFVRGRIIDLSRQGARKLGFYRQGLARVRIIALGEAASHVEFGQTRRRFVKLPNFEHGEFYVQVGVFSLQKNAQGLQDQLAKLGRLALIQPQDHHGRRLFRVWIQAGDTLSEALRLEQAMIEAGFSSSFVVAH